VLSERLQQLPAPGAERRGSMDQRGIGSAERRGCAGGSSPAEEHLRGGSSQTEAPRPQLPLPQLPDDLPAERARVRAPADPFLVLACLRRRMRLCRWCRAPAHQHPARCQGVFQRSWGISALQL
jgi:hypothetical protein